MDVVRPPLSKKQIKLKNEKRRKYEILKASKPLTNVTAKNVIEKKLAIKIDKLSPETKFTEEQLKELFKNPNKRLIYSFLGISGEQLKDADIVNKDVTKFLQRGEVSKAIYVCKLAQKKGVVAMNYVMKYLLEQERIDEAMSLFQYRKKWGVQPNEFTYSILFEGISNQSKAANSKIVASVMKILENLREKEELSVIHINTALKALFNSVEPTKALELFDSLSKKDKLDNKLFSVYLNGLSLSKNSDNFIIQQADACFEKAMNFLDKRQIDSRLILAYSLCYSKRKNLKYVARSINILRSWFNICDEDKITQKIRYVEPQDYKFQKIEPLTLDMIEIEDLNPFQKRLPLNNYILDVYITSLQTLGLPRKAVEVFDSYCKSVKVDIGLFNHYLSSFVKLKPVFEDMSLFKDNKFVKNLQKMKEFKLDPNVETNILISKFLEEKMIKYVSLERSTKLQRQNSIYFADFLIRLQELIFLLQQTRRLSLNLTLDYVKNFLKIQNHLTYEEQIRALNIFYFNNLGQSNISQHVTEPRHLQTVKSLEIATLTVLKNLVNSLLKKLDRDELTWSSINRIRNAIQSHVYYITNIKTIEDPGYSKLLEIEKEKVMSVSSYKTLVLKKNL